MCAKLHTLADHTPWSLNYGLFAPCIYVRIQRNANRKVASCNNISSFLQRTTPIARSFCEGFTRHDLQSWSQHHFVTIGPSGFIWFISICLRFKCFLILFCHFVLACLSVSFLFSGVPFIHSFFFFGLSVGCCAALLMLIFFYIYTASSPPLFQVGYTTNDW